MLVECLADEGGTWKQGVTPHLPCGVQFETTTLEMAPHIGWANVMPDAVGSVDIDIQGSKLVFQGPAYHDKVSKV